MSLELIPDLTILKDRSEMLHKSRLFFRERGLIEVDCCALNPYPAIDSSIDVIETKATNSSTAYLHTSPEYSMKKLISQGSGDIFYLGHVFRKEEIGRLHNPEFMMAEWYRIGFSFEQMIEETCAFISLFLGNLSLEILSYREVFETYVNIDYTKASNKDLLEAAKKLNLPSPSIDWSKETLLHFLLTHAIEPNLGLNKLTALIDYPPYEAALACIIQKKEEEVAERFELYFQGIELANGYHEFSDPNGLRERFVKENKARELAGKPSYPIDETFLSCLGADFPDCCGVSVGFDRLMLLRHQKKSLHEVLPFNF